MKNRKWLTHGVAGVSLAIFVVLGLASASRPPEFVLRGIGEDVGLDYTIRNAAAHLAGGIDNGTIVAVLSMESGSARMSSYLIEGMIDALVSIGGFGVANPFQLDLSSELYFNMRELDGWDAPEVHRSMELQSEWRNISLEGIAQSIGRFMGVQFVVMGTFEPFGDSYRFRAQAIEVETSAVRAVYTIIIENSKLIASLLGAAGRELQQPGQAQEGTTQF